MGISRLSFYETISEPDDTAIVEAMAAICDEFEHYGWRRVRATLRHHGMVVNHKKIKRLMREHDLQPKTRRHVAATDSDHGEPVFPKKTKGMVVDGPNQCHAPASRRLSRPEPDIASRPIASPMRFAYRTAELCPNCARKERWQRKIR